MSGNEDRVDVLVVGAGFAGLAALAQLRERGFAVMGVERGDEVGGTWYWNRYPGLRCDVESLHYSYSWDPRLEQEWEWTERYASQPEILRYAQFAADRLELRPLIRFGAEVVSMRFDEAESVWRVELSAGGPVTARWVVLATGAISTPKPIDIPGADSFAGESYETTRWPETPVDFAGKRVAVIGTGSSGIQVATEIAKEAAHLSVLQRTASYSLPAGNRPLTADEIAEWRANAPELREAARRSLDGLALPMTGVNAGDVSDEDRRAKFEELYAAGVPFTFFGIYNDILFDDESNRMVHEFLADKIRERVSDPAVAERLTPSGYPFGTRRCCIDSGYYEIFNQPNVELVDVREHPIVRITERGIETTGGLVEVDAIVYATGYDAFTGSPTRIDIRGTRGTLAEAWADGAHTYLGAAVPGFPNLFLVTGPQSPAVLSNMIVSIEQHVEWIVDALTAARDGGATRFEATDEAERAWLDHASELGELMVYRDASSWYVGANVEGKARVVLPYLGGVGPFRAKCEEVARNGYEGFVLTA
jgi:cyclohexanone monooxygenase